MTSAAVLIRALVERVLRAQLLGRTWNLPVDPDSMGTFLGGG
jgi:hypothetical protein